MDENTLGLLMGFLGGGVTDFLKLYKVREFLHEGFPEYAKSKAYWIVTTIMAVLGCLLVFSYQRMDEQALNPLLALNVGASAPLILGSLGKIRPDDPLVD